VALPFQTARGLTQTFSHANTQSNPAAHTSTHDTGTTLDNSGTLLQRPCYLFPHAARQQVVER